MTLLLTVFLIALCADGTAAATELPKRLSLDAATVRVADHVRQKKPRAQLQGFAVTELTTDAVWDRLKIQLVKVKEGAVEQSETFVLHGDRVLPIGQAFGGDGVTSIVVADLVGDKQPLLLYAFAWGSGVHRSEIGVLDLHGKEPKEQRLSPITLSMDDFALRSGKDGTVEVVIGETMIGSVTAVRKVEGMKATMNIADKLPEDVRRLLK